MADPTPTPDPDQVPDSSDAAPGAPAPSDSDDATQSVGEDSRTRQETLAASEYANVPGADRDEAHPSSPEAEGIDFASYVFPDTHNRAITGWFLLGIGAVAIAVWIILRSNTSVWNAGLLGGGIVLVIFGIWFHVSAWRLGLDQAEALVRATREVGFAVGHASAVLGFRGWRARPSWRILLYSADEPPTTRGLVELDGVNGEILAVYTEENPDPTAAPPSSV